jgi:PAS domain S-box-containing protein
MARINNYLIKKLSCVEREESAEAFFAVLKSLHTKMLFTLDKGKRKGIITPHSIIHTLTNKEKHSDLKVFDFELKPLPVANDDDDLVEIGEKIEKHGILAVLDKDGEIEGVITPESIIKYYAHLYSELERELDAVINFSSDEILVADGNGIILRANSIFEENFGVKLSDVIGKSVDELVEKKVFFPSVTRMVIEKGSTQTVIQSKHDGRKLLATGTPAFNEDNTLFRVVVNTRDITRLNNLKRQLEEAELLKNRYQQELVELRQGYLRKNEIVAESGSMQELIKIARRIADVESTVLLTGESGSGKGMVARYIHSCSPRNTKPFTTVNCGAIPENLLESELFGYAGGAFTGALREGKIGKLELANKGTLFLDEITELPLSLQVKLLHVMQEGMICRVGGTKEIKLDLRFIAATNRDITKMVEEGRFREDLFFRLDVIPLHVPPLRERLEDIRPLTELFLEMLNQRYQQQKMINPDVIKYLKSIIGRVISGNWKTWWNGLLSLLKGLK